MEQFWGTDMSSSTWIKRWDIPMQYLVRRASGTKSMIDKVKARTGVNTGGAVLEEEKNPLVTQRQSMFSAKEVEDMELEDMEEEESGINVFRKRRGSIFGNNSSTIFGN